MSLTSEQLKAAQAALDQLFNEVKQVEKDALQMIEARMRRTGSADDFVDVLQLISKLAECVGRVIGKPPGESKNESSTG